MRPALVGASAKNLCPPSPKNLLLHASGPDRIISFEQIPPAASVPGAFPSQNFCHERRNLRKRTCNSRRINTCEKRGRGGPKSRMRTDPLGFPPQHAQMRPVLRTPVAFGMTAKDTSGRALNVAPACPELVEGASARHPDLRPMFKTTRRPTTLGVQTVGRRK